jgi:hypothetical protein
MSSGVKSMEIIAVAGSGCGCRAPGDARARQFTESDQHNSMIARP